MPIAFALLGVGAVLLLLSIEQLLIRGDLGSFSIRSNVQFFQLAGPYALVLPLLATLVMRLGTRLPASGAISVIALAEYGISLLFGLVALIGILVGIDSSSGRQVLEQVLGGLMHLVLIAAAASVVLKLSGLITMQVRSGYSGAQGLSGAQYGGYPQPNASGQYGQFPQYGQPVQGQQRAEYTAEQAQYAQQQAEYQAYQAQLNASQGQYSGWPQQGAEAGQAPSPQHPAYAQEGYPQQQPGYIPVANPDGDPAAPTQHEDVVEDDQRTQVISHPPDGGSAGGHGQAGNPEAGQQGYPPR
jgi:hypothetical protein